jgi:hypothetical protein
MAFRTIRLSRVDGACPEATKNVNDLGYSLKMPWIDTWSHATLVINLKPLWDRTDKMLI